MITHSDDGEITGAVREAEEDEADRGACARLLGAFAIVEFRDELGDTLVTMLSHLTLPFLDEPVDRLTRDRDVPADFLTQAYYASKLARYAMVLFVIPRRYTASRQRPRRQVHSACDAATRWLGPPFLLLSRLKGPPPLPKPRSSLCDDYGAAHRLRVPLPFPSCAAAGGGGADESSAASTHVWSDPFESLDVDFCSPPSGSSSSPTSSPLRLTKPSSWRWVVLIFRDGRGCRR